MSTKDFYRLGPRWFPEREFYDPTIMKSGSSGQNTVCHLHATTATKGILSLDKGENHFPAHMIHMTAVGHSWGSNTLWVSIIGAGTGTQQHSSLRPTRRKSMDPGKVMKNPATPQYVLLPGLPTCICSVFEAVPLFTVGIDFWKCECASPLRAYGHRTRTQQNRRNVFCHIKFQFRHVFCQKELRN